MKHRDFTASYNLQCHRKENAKKETHNQTARNTLCDWNENCGGKYSINSKCPKQKKFVVFVCARIQSIVRFLLSKSISVDQIEQSNLFEIHSTANNYEKNRIKQRN